MARLIDADTLIKILEPHSMRNGAALGWHSGLIDAVIDEIRKMPTVGGWISVKDGLPSEHNSIFANHTHLSKHMWAMESNNVIVYVRFQDGTGRSTEGGLHDGKWWTRISPTLEPVVTHWKPFNEPPEEVTKDENY